MATSTHSVSIASATIISTPPLEETSALDEFLDSIINAFLPAKKRPQLQLHSKGDYALNMQTLKKHGLTKFLNLLSKKVRMTAHLVLFLFVSLCIGIVSAIREFVFPKLSLSPTASIPVMASSTSRSKMQISDYNQLSPAQRLDLQWANIRGGPSVSAYSLCRTLRPSVKSTPCRPTDQSLQYCQPAITLSAPLAPPSAATSTTTQQSKGLGSRSTSRSASSGALNDPLSSDSSSGRFHKNHHHFYDKVEKPEGEPLTEAEQQVLLFRRVCEKAFAHALHAKFLCEGRVIPNLLPKSDCVQLMEVVLEQLINRLVNAAVDNQAPFTITQQTKYTQAYRRTIKKFIITYKSQFADRIPVAALKRWVMAFDQWR